MVRKHDILDSVRVASPCPASWDEMEGGDRVRYCSSCRMNVYNVAEMRREEALRLIREIDGRLCLRLHRRQDGTLITRDCPRGVQALRRRAASAVAVTTALLVSIVALCSETPRQNGDSEWTVIRIHDAAWRAKLPSIVRSVIDRLYPLPPAPASAPLPGNAVMGEVLP